MEQPSLSDKLLEILRSTPGQEYSAKELWTQLGRQQPKQHINHTLYQVLRPQGKVACNTAHTPPLWYVTEKVETYSLKHVVLLDQHSIEDCLAECFVRTADGTIEKTFAFANSCYSGPKMEAHHDRVQLVQARGEGVQAADIQLVWKCAELANTEGVSIVVVSAGDALRELEILAAGTGSSLRIVSNVEELRALFPLRQ